jgi:hypothetical protein
MSEQPATPARRSEHAFKCPRCGSLAADYAEPHCKPEKNGGPFCGWFDCKHCKATWDSKKGTWYLTPV